MRTHGYSGTPLYAVWNAMIARCYRPSQDRYPYYGGRGITVCDEWKIPANFLAWAVAHGYQPGLQIDRKDNDGPYSPENCRWATRIEQRNNTTLNTFVTAFGETKTLAQWERDPRCGVKRQALWMRLYQYCWDPEIAIMAPKYVRSRPAKKWAS
jgi:hypothetical protein